MRTHPFTVEEVTALLRERGYIDADKAQDICVRQDALRARIAMAEGKAGRARPALDAITAAEVVASCNLQDARGNALDEDAILRLLAEAHGIRYEKIDPLKLDAALITSTVSLPFARRTNVLPLRRTDTALEVAVADPFDARLFEELRTLTKQEIVPVLTARADIQRMLTEIHGFRRSVSHAAKEMAPAVDIGNLEQLFSLSRIEEIESNDQHVVNAVDYLLHYALEQRVSDIHIEPKRTFSQVRMRIDGILHDIYRIPKPVHPAVVSRIKTMSRLDLAEKRRPQDGRFKTQRGDTEVEMRVSTLPVAFGEKVVVRVFDPTVLLQDIDSLGFSEDDKSRFLSFVRRPNGLILVTGPTGSGKTTTLYSTLRLLSGPHVNVVSIEDPIEMVVEEFNQIAVHNRIGLTFATALRHVLRQDPDIIMVGEIRDAETARQAVQAALTGHLVLSTLHTNDSASAVTRMIELGVDAHLLASTLVGVVAQRLVRCVCPKCKQPTALTADQALLLGIDEEAAGGLTVFEGAGCVHCRHTGLYGRTGIFELLAVTDSLRSLIVERADAPTLLRHARMDGTATLRESAIAKLAEGITSVSEVVRTTLDADVG